MTLLGAWIAGALLSVGHATTFEIKYANSVA